MNIYTGLIQSPPSVLHPMLSTYFKQDSPLFYNQATCNKKAHVLDGWFYG